MGRNLEAPFEEGAPRTASLYRARGDEVSATRPIFTGDVFEGLQLPGKTGKVKSRSVIVLQHPCSMRTNGVDLGWQVLVAEVSRRKEISEEEWSTGYFNLMPLPDLKLASHASGHYAANFDDLYVVKPGELSTRVASLSPFGVNLLLQRWVHYSSRVVVPTDDFQQQTHAFYEEADLAEEWCDEISSDDLRADAEAFVRWLRTDRGGSNYQEQLRDQQSHSIIRKAMRTQLKALRQDGGAGAGG
ncbi:hypothetical protein [Leifsonia sp. C5G2]|uniref:hypothetical protein n=1 Tax=Leifsonia sp. C5G2 TaxID=2735269 RepID=UPI001584DAE1|nr:hypothetical protein [Leifsonia sp. C5G2]NUU05190.1 hypothetical protein [Leifsonia sp. C5G2]